MGVDRSALQDLLAGMRGEYARNLPEKLEQVRRLWRAFAGGDAAKGEELLRAVHTISGAAATFGLPDIGSAALRLEMVLQPWCARGCAPGGDDRNGIENSIAQLLALSGLVPAQAGNPANERG